MQWQKLVTCAKVIGAIDFAMNERRRRLDSFAEKVRVRPSDLFIKVHMERITGAMLMRDPDLMPRDVAILLALIGEMDPGTGRINLCASELARKCDTRQSTVALSLSRLKKKLLVVPRQDKASKAYYMLVNPDFASVGGDRSRAIAAKQFKTEWIAALMEETGGDRERALASWESLINAGKAVDERQVAIEKEQDIARQKADVALQKYLATVGAS